VKLTGALRRQQDKLLMDLLKFCSRLDLTTEDAGNFNYALSMIRHGTFKSFLRLHRMNGSSNKNIIGQASICTFMVLDEHCNQQQSRWANHDIQEKELMRKLLKYS
jgi:hypothetical protein